MSTDKKTKKEVSSHPASGDSRQQPHEKTDKAKDSKEKKTKRVNYVVKDLPIY